MYSDKVLELDLRVIVQDFTEKPLILWVHTVCPKTNVQVGLFLFWVVERKFEDSHFA